MRLRLETMKALAAAALLLAAGSLAAHPLSTVGPEEALYQRVKALGALGLLDEADQARLAEGKEITRLELAFYTEKAKIKIAAPEGKPSEPAPAAPVIPEAPAPGLPAPAEPGLPEPVALPAQPTPVPAAPVPVTPAVRQEVDNLLKEFQQESSFLDSRLRVDDERLQRQEEELAKMKETQAKVDKAWKKANKVSGSPNFSTHANFIFEHLHLSPVNPASAASTFRQNATKAVNQVTLGMWSDLGGKGAISLGMSAYIPISNAASASASISAFSPSIQLMLDGPLGLWNTNATVEGYVGATTLGDFLRGVAPTSLKRFEKPFDVKNFDDPPNKSAKLWDDYMNSIGFVASASYASGAVQSTSDRVFDGVYALGSNLPLVSPDARLTLLVGRMGTTASETQKWEKAFKYQQPWLGGALRTSIGMIAVDDYMNDPVGTAQVNMRTYASDIGIKLDPLNVVLQGAYSTLYTGVDKWAAPPAIPRDTKEYGGPAAQVQATVYPFNLYVFAISDYFSNFQSKVMMTGMPWSRFGITWTADKYEDVLGGVGEVDNLQNNRWGWRANLGWGGRKAEWLKGLPKFMDDFTVNLDVAQKTEYSVLYAGYDLDGDGNFDIVHNYVEPLHMVTFYYPDDTGLWGSHMWGGYGAPDPVRQAFINNIQAIRYDGSIASNNIRWQFQMTSERIPLFGVVGGQPLDAGGTPFVPATAGPNNSYYTLPHRKTFDYITLTTKWQLHKMFDLPRPVDLSVYFTKNTVSGVAPTGTPLPPGVPQNIPDLYSQFAGDATVMVQVMKNVAFLGNFGMEDWDCRWTWPMIEYHTRAYGAGFSWDLPWGGGKFETRYKHLTFTDVFVPDNSFQGDQIFSQLQFAF